MSVLRLNPAYASQPESVSLNLTFTSGATPALVCPANAPVTLARSATGTYTITLVDKFVGCMSCNVAVLGADASTIATKIGLGHFYNAATGVLTVWTGSTVGTASNPGSTENVSVNAVFTDSYTL